MLSFYDVFDRFLEGPHVAEMDFDLGIFHKLTQTIKKYGIKYDPDNPIPNDDRMADDLFQAGLEFFEKSGVYCVDSQRVVTFTRQEILEALREAPSEPVFGEGQDAKKLIARPADSNQVPWCFIGAAGSTVTDERILSAMVESFGMNPLGNSITTPNIQKVDGRSIVAGTPLEILGSIRTVHASKEALKKAGRPGMPLMNSISTAVTDTAKIAGSQFDLRPSDGTMIGSMSEFNIIAKGESPIARVFILFQVMVEWGLVSARPLMAEKRESRFQMVSRRHRAYAKMGQPL
jgi:methylamine--corrinoid protein Co-methyltransferase